VQDADTPIRMHLTSADKARAAHRRRNYDIDEGDNFTGCALAECLSRMNGADVLVMRRFAFVALPDAKYTLRYQLDPETAAVVQANDIGELDRIAANAPISFMPPTPGRQLVKQGGPRVDKKSRGILANPPQPGHPDPFQGIVRHGRRAHFG
jgi:hypothetical protein